MKSVKELEVRLETAKEKVEVLEKALESARIAFNSIRYQYEAAIEERDETMEVLIKALMGQQ